MSFWDSFEPRARESHRQAASRPVTSQPAPPATLTDYCEVCGFVHADVLLGVCADCAPKE